MEELATALEHVTILVNERTKLHQGLIRMLVVAYISSLHSCRSLAQVIHRFVNCYCLQGLDLLWTAHRQRNTSQLLAATREAAAKDDAIAEKEQAIRELIKSRGSRCMAEQATIVLQE